MKTVFVSLSGEPKPGDFIALVTSHRERGGASTVYHRVRDPWDEVVLTDDGRRELVLREETLKDVVQALVQEVGRDLGFGADHYSATVRSDTEFIVKSSDAMDNNRWYGVVEGSGTVQMKVDVL
jgi:hypothetical protein